MAHKAAGLGPFQLLMLALGMVVGGSFFLGTAIAIREAGPAIVVAFALGGMLVFIILSALSELTVADPSPGSFRTYAHRALGPYAGYVVGWMYWLALVLAMSSEAIAASVFLKHWLPAVGAPTLASLVIITVTGGNLLGAGIFSRLEGGLAAIKVTAIIAFVVIGIALISGLFPGVAAVGAGVLPSEPVAPRGISGLAGSMLIVMFTYAGFEVIGLASSDARDPGKTVPRAIRYTVVALSGLYLATLVVLLPLVHTGVLNESAAPIAAALSAHGLTGLANIANIVLVTAILSTLLAALFGLGRMLHSLALEEQAPHWLAVEDSRGVPRRAILASGGAMLAGLALGYVLPDRVYLFLVSSSGFALLFSYLVIMLAHYRLRRQQGCLHAECQLPGYPYTSWLGIASIIAIIASMPLIRGQGDGLAAGLSLVAAVSLAYGLGRARDWAAARRMAPSTWAVPFRRAVPLRRPEGGPGDRPEEGAENRPEEATVAKPRGAAEAGTGDQTALVSEHGVDHSSGPEPDHASEREPGDELTNEAGPRCEGSEQESL